MRCLVLACLGHGVILHGTLQLDFKHPSGAQSESFRLSIIMIVNNFGILYSKTFRCISSYNPQHLMRKLLKKRHFNTQAQILSLVA